MRTLKVFFFVWVNENKVKAGNTKGGDEEARGDDGSESDCVMVDT